MYGGSDHVGGLLELVDQGVLTLDLVEDGDLSLDVLGLHEQLGAVDQSLVPCMVEPVGALGEHVPEVSIQSDFLFVPDQLVVAVGRGAVLVVDGLVIQNGSGDFLVQIVLVDDLGVVDLHGTLGAVDLVQRHIGSVGIGGVDFHLVDGAVGVVETGEHIVLGVANGVPDVHVRGDLGHLVGLCQVHDLLDVVSGVVAHGAGVTVQQGLPVVAAGESVLAHTGQLHITDDALLQQALHLDVVVVELVLMENGEQDVVCLGGVDQILNHLGGLAQGLLAQDVEAVGQQILGDGVVQIGVGSVGDEVQLILVGEQLGVIGQGLAAEDLTGSGGTVGVSLDNVLDVADVVVSGAQEGAVDVAAGTAETDDGDVEFLHVQFSFFVQIGKHPRIVPF